MNNSDSENEPKWQHEVLKIIIILALFALVMSSIPAHAGPLEQVKTKVNQIKGDTGAIKGGVNLLHKGMGRAFGKINDLQAQLESLPEKQRDRMLKRFADMQHNPAMLRDRIDEFVGILNDIADPAQAYISGSISKIQAKLAQQMNQELDSGRPGPISLGFGFLYDLTDPFLAVLAGNANGTQNDNSIQHARHQQRSRTGLLDDPQTLSDCIEHRNKNNGRSVAAPRCVIRLLGKPAGNAICDTADLIYDLMGDAMPDDVTSWYVKSGAVMLFAAVPRQVCIIARMAGSMRDALKVDDELRFKIETNLLVAESQPLFIFQLPNQFGGKLEQVEQVVRDAIDNAKAANLNTAAAERHLNTASHYFSSTDYKLAYLEFGAAYRALAGTP